MLCDTARRKLLKASKMREVDGLWFAGWLRDLVASRHRPREDFLPRPFFASHRKAKSERWPLHVRPDMRKQTMLKFHGQDWLD